MLRLPCALAAATLLVALANVVILRTAGAEWLTDYRFGFMAVTTATAFALLSGALLLRLVFAEERWAQITAWAAAALVAAFGLYAFIWRTTGQTTAWEAWFDAGIPVKVPYQMLRTTAVLLFLSAYSLGALTRGESRVPWVRETGVVVASGLVLLGFLSVVSSTAGSPVFSRTEPLNVSMLTALVVGCFNGALLLSVSHTGRLRRLIFGVYEVEDLPPLLRNDRAAFGVLGLAILVILAGIVLYLRSETGRLRRRVGAELQVALELKADQLTSWRQERMGDARALSSIPDLPRILGSLTSGQAGPERRAELERWLQAFARTYNYERAVLLDATLSPVLAGSGGSIPAAAQLQAQLRVAAGGGADVRMLAPYADEAGELRLDFLAGLPGPAGHAPIGAVLLQSKPSRTILPMLQVWPYGNETGQFVLWRRVGNRLYSLGGYRAGVDLNDADQRPFSQVRNLDDPNLLIARAAAGDTGLVEGTDVRGIPIVGLGRRIPETDWLLTCRIDASELYGPLRRSAWQIVGATLVVFSGIGFFVTRRMRSRQLDLLRERIVAELAQKRTAARLGAVMGHARDIILILDPDLNVVEANQCAVDTYGWSHEELCRMNMRDLRSPASLMNYPQTVAMVREQGAASFESEHRRKDGSVFPIDVRTTLVEIDGRKHFLPIIRDITERKRAEADLRASEERYRLIAENTSDVIWLYDLALEGFNYVSAAALPVLGFRPEELLGARLTATLTEESAAKGAQILQQMSAGLQAGGQPQHTVVEMEQRHKDGRIIPSEVTVSLLPGPTGQPTLLLGITRDITERKKARETLLRFNADLEVKVEQRTAELAARNQETQALLDALPDTVLLCDERGALIFARSVKYPAVAGLVSGQPMPGQLPPLDAFIREIITELHAAVLRGRETVVQEFERLFDNGVLLTLEARATAIGAQRVLILLRDVSARKKVERDVLANLDREKQLSEMKSQFISVASHEFRTPLAAAVGSLELLERHAARLPEAKRQELLTRIQRSLGRLTTIMNDVLQLSRADSGRVKVKRMDTDVGQFVQDIITEVKAGSGEKHRFEFHRSGGPDVGPVDTNLVHHILSNLVSNAVRYSPAGTAVTVQLELTAEAFTLRVSDEGIGIPEADRDRVFEPFARGSNVGQIGGTGLGLNIVKRYTELMGGRIELLPSARGAVFQVIIPFHPAGSPPPFAT